MRKAALPLVVSLALLGGAAGLSGTASPASAAPQRLQPFSGCGELLRYVKKQALPLVGAYGLPGSTVGPVRGGIADNVRAAAPTAGTPGIDFSTTNVQEEGVDEPDLVKTDGGTLFTIAQGRLRSVDVRGGAPTLADSLALNPSWGHELLLDGGTLLVLSRGAADVAPQPEPQPGAPARLMPYYREQTVLSEIDVRDPERLRLVRTMTLDGNYVSARLSGGLVRLVVTSPMPSRLEFVTPAGGTPEDEAAATARNRKVVRASRVARWLPTARIKERRTGKVTTRSLVQCRSVRRPQVFSGLGTLTVLTLDLQRGLDPIDSDAVLTDGQIVYASPDALYVATQRWAQRPDPAATEIVPEGFTTAIHKFDTSQAGRTEYRGSGQVAGMLLNQWSLSELRGVLRIASTDLPSWWDPGQQRPSESFVTTLQEEGGKLVQLGRVGELGKGERIYSVRFIGDVGYVVTFRQVDPLYTIDLSQPARPRVLGELKIQGFSSYLHPVGEDLLLGVGQDATEEGRVTGAQLSLFDISNLSKPERLHQKLIGAGHSEAEYDHHAFLYWPLRRLVVLPIQTYAVSEGDTFFGGVIGFRVSRAGGIAELGRVSHPAAQGGSGGTDVVGYATPIRRSLVVRGALLTVSEAGVKASGLETFAEIGWLPFS